jgi:hypothetical protein
VGIRLRVRVSEPAYRDVLINRDAFGQPGRLAGHILRSADPSPGAATVELQRLPIDLDGCGSRDVAVVGDVQRVQRVQDRPVARVEDAARARARRLVDAGLDVGADDVGSVTERGIGLRSYPEACSWVSRRAPAGLAVPGTRRTRAAERQRLEMTAERRLAETVGALVLIVLLVSVNGWLGGPIAILIALGLVSITAILVVGLRSDPVTQIPRKSPGTVPVPTSPPTSLPTPAHVESSEP